LKDYFTESESAFISTARDIKTHYWQNTAKRPLRSSESAAPMAVTFSTWFALDMKMVSLLFILINAVNYYIENYHIFSY